MEQNKIGHLYAAKVSKSGKYVNLTVVMDGDNGSKIFINVPVKRNAFDGKPSAQASNGVATFTVKIYNGQEPALQTNGTLD